MRSAPPRLDVGVRQRLIGRFGPEVGAWFDELPAVLNALAESWQVQFGPLIPRGSMSVVIRCRLIDGRPAVLKVSPDRTRLSNEAAALDRWTTVHTPSVLAVDESVGALLLEAIEPGIALVDSPVYPRLESVAELLTSLHATGVPTRPTRRSRAASHASSTPGRARIRVTRSLSRWFRRNCMSADGNSRPGLPTTSHRQPSSTAI
jgi:streptomycin 6-kinase